MANEKTSGFRNAENELDDVFSKVVTKVLGIAQTTVSKHKEIFEPLPGPRGHYNLPLAVQRYINYKTGTDGTKEGQNTNARTNLYGQQTRRLELANDVQAGRLIDVNDASGVVGEIAAAIRAGLKALPGRLATQLAANSNAAQCRALINDEVESLLEALQVSLTEAFPIPEGNSDGAQSGVDPEKDPGPNPGRVGGRKKNTANRKRRTRKVAK